MHTLVNALIGDDDSGGGPEGPDAGVAGSSDGFGGGGASSDLGDGGWLGSVFRDGPMQRGSLTTTLLAEKKPGDIFALGLQAVREKLAATHGDSVLTHHSRNILSFYFDQVLKPSLPSNIAVHTERELRTIAVGLDKLIEGNIVSCGDVFMGRFKALEESLLSDGGWEVVRKHEVVPQRQVGITSEEERQRVMAL